MQFARPLASTSLLLAVVVAGGCYQRPVGPVEARVVYEFEGVVENGQVRLWGAPVGEDGGDGDFARAMQQRQALTPITEDKNGQRGTAAVANSIEMTVQRDAPFTAPSIVVGGCGTGNDSFDMTVGVRNFHATRLANAHVEMTSIVDNAGLPNPGTGDHSLCNTEPVGPNLEVGGAPPSNALGLIRYGNLGADGNGFGTAPADLLPEPRGTDATAHAMLWRFRNGAGNFSFFGRVIADVCAAGDCTPGTLAAPRGIDTDGVVNAVAEGDGLAFIGGDFTRVGPRTGSAFRTSDDALAAGLADPDFPAFEGGSVEAIEPDGAGGYYVGGSFTQVGETAAARLVHLKNVGGVLTLDGTFSPATLTASGTVLALELDAANSTLWVGRLEAPFLTVLDTATNSPSTTVVPAAVPGDSVRQITKVSDTEVVVAGNFSNLGANNRNKVAVYTAADGALTAFSAPVGGGGGVAVESFAVDGNLLYIAGSFQTVGPGNGNKRNRLAALALDTGALQPWNPDADAQVSAIVVDTANDIAYVGGAFGTIGGVARNRLAALTSVATVAAPAPTAFNPAPSNNVNALALDASGQLLVGGLFTTIGTEARRRVAVLDAAGAVQPWDPSVTGEAGAAVREIVVDGGHYHIGGSFSFGGGAPRSNLAAIELGTGDLAAFDGGVGGGVVNALAVNGATVYVGGTFATAGGEPHARLAAFSADGVVDSAFTAAASNTVRALVADSTGLYVGGDFATLGGLTRSRLGRLTLGGGDDATFVPPALNNTVRAIAVDASGVFVGGDFNSPARSLARLSGTGALVADLNANGVVNALAVRHQRLYVGGDFSRLAGGNRTHVAAIVLATNTVDAGFSAPSPNDPVLALAVAGNTVVIGGGFSTPRAHVASLDNATGGLQSFAPLATADGTSVNAVAVSGSSVLVGGQLAPAGSLVSSSGASALRTSFFIAHAE